MATTAAKNEFTSRDVEFSSTKTVTFGDGKIVKFPSAKGKLVHFRANETPLWAVTATMFCRETGNPVGLVTTETLFKNHSAWVYGYGRTKKEVKQLYEAFWNDVNPHSYAVVFVTAVHKYA
ncbi:MAG: hypothetical protein D4R44_02015 [Actinobacteria bacterium]|nr:MAG: hypothetical protein D4R44_02015 [Actinomycetota bacterium]